MTEEQKTEGDTADQGTVGNSPFGRTPEIEFNPDERALLDVLHRRAANDGCVRANDTQLISDLGLSEDEVPGRFFAPKMRLVTAGVISLFLNGSAGAVIRLNMPERKKQRSERYVFLVVPLELAKEVCELVRDHRVAQKLRERDRLQKQRNAAKKEVAANDNLPTPASTANPPSAPTLAHEQSRKHRVELAQSKLGVHAVRPGPIRPPMAKQAGQS